MSATAFAGRVALVTGASRGIGRAIARRLAAHGAAMVVTSSARSRDGLDETRRLIEAAGGKVATVEADLADPSERARLMAEASSPHGPISILVNNAAANPAYAPPSKIDLAARHATFEINFHAPVDLIQQAVTGMRQRGWGRILNITSAMVHQPSIPYSGPAKFIHTLTIYGASKAALDRYTVGLAAELHGSGVTANAVAPCSIALTESAEKIARQAAATHPDWIEPLEMMAEAAYLLIAGGSTGIVARSRDVLHSAQSPLHALDGKTVIGDAMTIPVIA